MDELAIYILFLERLIDDLEQEIEQLKLENRAYDFMHIPIGPNPETTKPWEPKWGKIDTCPKCGIQLNQVMSYSCPHLDCPTGLGPVWCKA